MHTQFNTFWNLHYGFDDPANRTEIDAVENYRLEADAASYKAGQVVDSPWGNSQVLEARSESGQDLCIKDITIKPGYMLSLQRHRGRDEEWKVTDGRLTVIVNDTCQEIAAGQSFVLTRGMVHSMINSSRYPVIVQETQRGICRERDNVRLVDFNNRPVYPITSEMEFRSAKLYARIQREHWKNYGFGKLPHESLLE